MVTACGLKPIMERAGVERVKEFAEIARMKVVERFSYSVAQLSGIEIL